MAASPSSWLVENADLLPKGGQALDVACGRGRNALFLAAAGLSVHAVDRDAQAIDSLRASAERLGLPVQAVVLDLETGHVDLGREDYDLILCIRYLHRPLFPVLIRALRPGGLLVYETFTVGQAARGQPKNPEFLLHPGELRRLVAPLEILRQREGGFDAALVSGVIARRRP